MNFIYRTETDSQTQRRDLWLLWGREGLGAWGSQMQTITFRMDKQLLHSTGSYIQRPVINYNGKEHEKEYMCVCIITLL